MKFEAPALSAKRVQDKFEKSESPKDLLTKSRSQKKFLADKGVDADSISYNECTSIIMTVWTEPAFDSCSSAWQVICNQDGRDSVIRMAGLHSLQFIYANLLNFAQDAARDDQKRSAKRREAARHASWKSVSSCMAACSHRAFLQSCVQAGSTLHISFISLTCGSNTPSMCA